jgi:CubicO group peptidase (beta-lactamase class C family)
MNLKKVDNLFKKYIWPVPWATVMVIKNGEVIFKNSYGMGQVSKGTKTTTITNFRLASVTKQFTATCIVKLVEQWKIKYSDKIINFFPKFPHFTKNITIQDLLTHTSWLPDDYEIIPKNRKNQIHDKDIPCLMEGIKKLHFSPWDRFRYINTGYCLLALIIEKASWLSFGKFLKKYIFSPLKMNNTYLCENWWKEIKHRAYWYAKKWKVFVPKDQSITSATCGDGGIYSNIEDLYKRDQALYTDKIVSFVSLRKMFSATKLHNGKKVFYGFGEEIDHDHWVKALYHWWESSWFRNFIYRIPSKKTSVIFLSNRNIWWWENLAKKILEFSWLS